MDNKTGFIELIKQNEGLIHKITRVYTDNNEDKQDLYQEIVYQAWKAFPSFRKESKSSTWMYRIALNTSITHLRKEKRKGTQIPIDEEHLNKTEPDETLQEERIEVLYAHIRKLDPIEKGIILLHLEGKHYDEIAAITGFTVTNVGTRLNRIRQKLTAQIKK